MNDVFANGRGIACKAGSGKAPAAFPDVCMTPPENPATPPGVPVPYPNTGMESDTSDGSRTVVIHGQEVMLKSKSYFKSSMGDEAGCAAKKGVVTSVNRGKVYFIAWSMDVKFEGENVDRHLDLTTHNHASPVTNTPPFPNLSTIKVDPADCPQILADNNLSVHRHRDANCPDGYQSDHVVQDRHFTNTDGTSISTMPGYNRDDAPCICLYGGTAKKGSAHGKKTQMQMDQATARRRALRQDFRAGKIRREETRIMSYKDARDENLKMLYDSKRAPKPSPEALKCLQLRLDEYFLGPEVGASNGAATPVRIPWSRGKFRLPPGS